MENIKKILVPTDFSPFSTNALNYAAQIAKSTGALIEIANIHFVDDPDLKEDIQPQLKEYLNQTAQETRLSLVDSDLVSPTADDVACKLIVRQGFIVDEIVSYSNQNDVDLIVMGTRGAGAMKRFILGTNTADVIEKANCSVLSVPGQAVYNGFNTLLFAFEFQEGLLEKISYLYHFAGSLGTTLQLLHVIDPESEIHLDSKVDDLKKALQLKKMEGIHIQIIDSLDNNIKSSITAYCQNYKPDILALAPASHSYFNRLFGISVTKRLSFHTETPVLAIKI